LQTLLKKQNVNSEELQMLLEARKEGKIKFLLVDVREEMEYNIEHIKGVDMLKPTTVFQQWAHELLTQYKDTTLIFTCRTGNRSTQVQHIFMQHGHKNAINHYGGIVTYRGAIES
jgi:rhodanese-related sulfurtransferase